MKESKNKSKTNDLKYKKLERQEYLEEQNVTEAKTVIRFLTKWKVLKEIISRKNPKC